MKNSILIDSGLSNGFSGKVMETANYLRNKLPTKRKSDGKVILKELWINQK